MHTRDLCKLTGKRGKFVKSHLIPKALTRPAVRGQPFLQAGMGTRPVRRWDSWYDSRLTIRQGEKILAKLDDWAITELRQHELVWSGWRDSTLSNVNLPDFIPGTNAGIRHIIGIDTEMLRLFFLSLLWRAAATHLQEFSAITIPADDLEKLRRIVLSEESPPLDFYPATLVQLHTMGEIHNLTPISDMKIVPYADESRESLLPIFRFYLDGLIVHFHRHASDDGYAAKLGPLIVGGDAELIVTTVSYETSFQKENLDLLKDDFSQNYDPRGPYIR